MKSDLKIRRMAYAKSWSQNGFKYFVTRGSLTWFLLLYVGFTTISIFCGYSITIHRIFINFIITIFLGLLVGALVFPIISWQSRKLEQKLTESEEQKVQEMLRDLRPFRQINIFIIFSFVFISLVIWFIGYSR